MPNLNGITLNNPGAFRSGAAVTITAHYGPRFNNQYCTLHIFGYKLVDDTNHVTYTGGKFTQTASYHQSGEGIVQFNIPAGVLGPDPSSYGLYSLDGSPQACVVFSNNGDEDLVDGHVPDIPSLPHSNTITLQMTLHTDTDLTFEYTQQDGSYLATGSSFLLWLHLTYRRDSLKSYRILLYNDNDDILSDSGMKKDWLFPTYYNHSYRLRRLKDKTTYYVKAKVTMTSGIELETQKVRLYVDFEQMPQPSPNVTLESVPTGVKLNVDLAGLTYDKIIINRVAFMEGLSLTLKTASPANDIYTMIDHYPIPEKTYIYNVVVYNGNTIVNTFSNNIAYKSNYVVISDAFGSYAAVGNITKYPVSRNDRGQEIEVMDNQYPYYLINGEANYERGSVDGIFGELENCELQTDNVAYSRQLREWLNNGQPKLLCYYNGESWIVAVSGVQTTDPNNTETLNTSFNWVQIGDGEDTSAYEELGLMNNG